MKRTLLSLVLVTGPLATAQQRLSPATALARKPDEITEAVALRKAADFLALVGERIVDRRRFTYYIDIQNPVDKNRAYEIDYGAHHLEIDTSTGRVNVYWLSSSAFPRVSRRTLASVPSGSVVGPTEAQAQSIVAATARVVGLPPGARLTHFAVRDRNPHPDADMRGYVSAVYVGSDRSTLRLVFDRASGRLENLIRTPPHAVSAPSRAPVLYKGGRFPLPPRSHP